MPVRGSNSLYFSSELNTDGLRRGATEATGIVQNLATTIGRISPFGILAAGAATAFSAVAQSSYNMMKEFEQNMKEVETISKATQENFKGISSEVFALSKISPNAPAALAKAYYQIVSAGYDGAAGLELLETAANAATGGVTDTMTAADGITTVLNAFKLEAKEAENVADIMFTTVKNGKTTFEELSRQMSTVAPLAAASGYSFEEVAAAIATLTKQGVPTSQAMTQIRSGIEALGEVLGDGAAKTMTLQNAFQAMYDQAGGSQNKLKELTGRVEAMSATLAIAGPNAQGAAKDLQDMADAAGAAEEANKRMLSSNTNEWDILYNRISATTEGIGDSLVEMSSGIARFMNDALDDSNDLTASLDQQRVELYKLTDALKAAEEGSDEWKKIRDQILTNYPQFIGQIDAETASTRQLLGVLEDVNRAYIERYKVNQRNQKLNQEREKQAQIEMNLEDTRKTFDDIVYNLKAEAERNGIDLKINFDQTGKEIVESIREQIEAVDPDALNKSLPLRPAGFAAGDLQQLEARANIENAYINSLKEQKRLVEEISQDNRAKTQEDLKTAEGKKLAIENIGKAMKEADLSEYVGSGVEEVEWAIEKRRRILEQREKIKQVENIESLKPFLESEIKEVREYAKKMERMLTTEIDTVPKGSDKTFDDLLKQKEEKYKEYYIAVEQLGKESADKLFQTTLEQGENFNYYLLSLLEESRTAAEKISIALAAERNGFDLNRKKAEPVSELTSKGVQEFTIDTTSINAFQRKIAELQTQIDAEQDESRRRELQAERDKWQERLDIARNGASEEKSIFEKIPAELSDLNNKALKEYRQYWKERLKEAEKGSKAEDEAEVKVNAASKIIGDRTADTIREVSGSLGEASDMFRKFGDEDLADALEKMQSLGNSIATIIAGVAAGGPLGWLQAAGGVLGGLGSLFSGGGNDEVSAYERSINNLEKSIKSLTREMDKLYGIEKIDKRDDIITDLEEEAKLRREAIKDLQFYIASYRGTAYAIYIPGLEEELEAEREALKEAEDKLWAANEDQRNALTGTTVSSIADSIIEGFRQGKRGAEDFADTFEDLMKEAMLNSFKNEYLMNLLTGEGGFYDAFSEASRDGLTEDEVKNLQGLLGNIVDGAEESLEGMDRVFDAMGWDSFGASGSQPKGMSEAIRGITEDQAGLLEGYWNAVRIDTRALLENSIRMINIATLQSEHLSEIAANTRYNRHLEEMNTNIRSLDGRMATIESGIQNWGAQG